MTKIEIMMAHESGANIESKPKIGGSWMVDANPDWNWQDYDYRIKSTMRYREILEVMEQNEIPYINFKIEKRVSKFGKETALFSKEFYDRFMEFTKVNSKMSFILVPTHAAAFELVEGVQDVQRDN